MKQVCKKISAALKTLFGWGILVALFGGGLTFFGYLAAIVIGGDTAAVICEVIYKQIFPVLIYLSTVMVLLGLVAMYLSGEKALTSDKKKTKK